MPDVILGSGNRTWMRDDPGTMPRQKLMRATLEALTDIAKAQDLLAVGTQREFTRLEQLWANRASEQDEQLAEILAAISRINDTLEAVVSRLSEPAPEIEPEPEPGPAAELADDTSGWELREYGVRQAMPDDALAVERHPSNPDSPIYDHWLAVLYARELTWQFYQRLIARGERVTHKRIARALSETKAWRNTYAHKVSVGVVGGVMHATVMWEYREVEGEVSAWPFMYIRPQQLEAVTAALEELLQAPQPSEE